MTEIPAPRQLQPRDRGLPERLLNNGEPCDDGDVCNGVDSCQEGQCVPGERCSARAQAMTRVGRPDLCHGDYVAATINVCSTRPASSSALRTPRGAPQRLCPRDWGL